MLAIRCRPSVASLLPWAVAAGCSFVLGLVGAILLYAIVTWHPKLMYDARKPSTLDECRQIKVGSSLAEALAVPNSNAPPSVQRLSADQFVFMRGDAACVVDLDPSTKRVVRVSHKEPETAIWLP